MKVAKIVFRRFLLVVFGCVGSLWLVQPIAADANASLPRVIRAGLDQFAKGVTNGGGSGTALALWQKGGLLEDDQRVAAQTRYFQRMERSIGNYRFHELIESKKIGQSSQVLYLSLNFERAAVYARFLLYHTEKDWVVQNMRFSTRPEEIMPWLALQAGDQTE